MSFHLVAEEQKVRAGEKNRLVLEAVLERGWSIYSLQEKEPSILPLEIKDDAQEKNIPSLTPWYETNPQKKYLPVLGKELLVHKDWVKFYKNFSIPPTQSQNFVLQVQITFQACNEKICLPPKTVQQSLALHLEPGEARSAFQAVKKNLELPPTQVINSSFGNAFLEDFFGKNFPTLHWVLLCFLGGVLALATPCLLPVVPLVLNFFHHGAKKNAKGGKSKKISLWVAFLFGITGVYSLTALLLTFFLGPFGVQQFAANPITNLFTGVLFSFFAFSLLGFFQIRFPQSWLKKLDRMSHSPNVYFSAFVIGISFTLSSFTCNIQIIGALLAGSASTGYLYTTFGLFSYAFGFAFPIAMSAFIPGIWQIFKKGVSTWFLPLPVFIAVLEFMVAIKFFSNADVAGTQWLHRNTVLGVYIFLCLFAIGFLFFRYHEIFMPPTQRKKQPSFWQSLKNPTFLLYTGIFLFAAVFLSQGLGNYTLGNAFDALLPPLAADEELKGGDFVESSPENKLVWFSDFSSASQEAKKQNKPIFIDFTGYVCTNCRWMENYIFRLERVHHQLKNEFVLLRLYTDLGSEAKKNQDFQLKKFQTVALPFYVIFDKNQKLIKTHTGIVNDGQEFVQFLTPSFSLSFHP